MRNMFSDKSLGISSGGNEKTGDIYSIDAFYDASGDCTADIFRCLENDKLYVPGENELLLYNEPRQSDLNRTKPQKAEPSSLLGELNDAKAEADARGAAPKDRSQTKKRVEPEV